MISYITKRRPAYWHMPIDGPKKAAYCAAGTIAAIDKQYKMCDIESQRLLYEITTHGVENCILCWYRSCVVDGEFM